MGDAASTRRFRARRRGLTVFWSALGIGFLAIGVARILAGESWWLTVVLLVNGVLHLIFVCSLRRQGVVVTDIELIALHGVSRRARVAWHDVERIHLDWKAEAEGRPRDVLRVERASAETLRSPAATGMGDPDGPLREPLEAALRERADAYGFDVEVSDPSWRRLGTDSSNATDDESRG